MNCKRIVAALMCAVIPLGIAISPVGAPAVLSAEAASVVDSGTCGKNLTWKLESSGTLTVSGTGDMNEDLDSNPCPWKEYSDEIKNVIIGTGVTSIGMGMFDNCNNLTSLSLPDTLKTISAYSFSSCKSLESVVIPNGVTNIGTSAFSSCKKLSNVTIPASVTNISALAFSGTPWFEAQRSIDTPFVIINGLLINVFYKLSGDVVIPSTVNKICDQAAWGCSEITSLTIPETVTEIGHNAFNGCEQLKSVTIPSSVENIGMQAFIKCTALSEVFILNPDAKIYDRANTFTNENDKFSGVIKGYKGSTAEKYAQKYNYTFKTLAQLGDVNSDEYINAVDASSVLAYYAMISTNQDGGYDEEQKLAPDVDHDGKINAVDASNILSYYAYVSTTKETPMSMEEYMKKLK